MATTDIQIKDSDLTSLKDKVILITGGSSGIGLASVKLFLSLGAKVISGDVNPSPISSPDLLHQHVDVTDWKSQLQLFKKAVQVYGKIDHVFANAGIISHASYLEEDVDSAGDLLPPDNATLNVNLIGVVYTCKLGVYYLKKNPGGGSVLITASVASFGNFFLTDYCTAKHAVLGLMRGLHANLEFLPHLNIRINALAPCWTATGMVPGEKLTDIDMASQSPDIVARSAALVFADATRQGQVIYSQRGRYAELGGPIMERILEVMALEQVDLPQGVDKAVRLHSILTGKDA